MPKEIKINHVYYGMTNNPTKLDPNTLGEKPDFILKDENAIKNMFIVLFKSKTKKLLDSQLIGTVIRFDNQVIYVGMGGEILFNGEQYKVDPVQFEEFLYSVGYPRFELKPVDVPKEWWPKEK